MGITLVHLTCHMHVPDNRMAVVQAAVVDHIALTRAEEGCISFKVTPCPDVKYRFLVAETFECRAAFDAHQIRTKASPWAKITARLPREYSITEGYE